MKKVMILSLLLVSFALICTESKAQTTKRIEFAKGKNSAVVKGTTGIYGVTYVVRAKSGQKLVLNLTPAAKVGIKVETNDGRYWQKVLLREERGGIYEIGLEETGDYTIFVGSTGKQPASFTLTVKITKMTDI